MPYILNVEVPGHLSSISKVDWKTSPPTVRTVDFVFDGWLGDDIVQSFPVFAVTQRLADAISAAGLSGATFAEMGVAVSSKFKEIKANTALPTFMWMKVNGKPNTTDFWLSPDNLLVISDKAMNVFRRFSIAHATITQGTGL